MCLPDGEAKMPLSKIIKSAAAEASINTFNFRTIIKGEQVAGEQQHLADAGFVPLEIFDPSELSEPTAYAAQPQPEPEEVPEIPGRFIADEELMQIQQESYQQGLQDGKSLAERGLANVFRGMRTAADDLQQLREKVLHESEDNLLALALMIARRVILREVSQDHAIVVQVVKEAVRDLNSADELTIRLHPDDHALLTTSLDQALRSELAGISFGLKPDTAVMAGFCQVDTALGTVDADLDAQLEEVYRKLLEARTAGAGMHEQAGGL